MFFQRNNRKEVSPAPEASFEFVHASKPYYVQMNKRVKPSSEKEIHLTIQNGLWNGVRKDSSDSQDSHNLDDAGIRITRRLPDGIRIEEPYPFLRVHCSCNHEPARYIQNKITFLDEFGEACAVMFKVLKNEDRYELYGFQPYTLGRRPNRRHDDMRPLYHWGTVVNGGIWGSKRSFSLVMVNGVRYHAWAHNRTNRAQGPNLLPWQNQKEKQNKQKNLLEYHVTVSTPIHTKFEPCAIFQENTDHGWDIVAGRGLDANLMVSFVMMLDNLIRVHQ